jgi:predicted ATP-dependent endonuclease of OLD family
VQVAYATHSEHFVDPAHYERLRRFRRCLDVDWPQSEVTHATIERVVERLKHVYQPEQIPLRVQMSLRRQVAEAVFAKAVLLVEGDSDAGLLHGVADRDGGLDALGVAVVQGHGKRQVLIPWAILSELGVPTYVVFDGDAGLKDRMLGKGRTAADAEAAQAWVGQENQQVLRTLGLDPEAQPGTAIAGRYAVFADTIETEAATWEGFDAAVKTARDEHGDFRVKSDDAYRHAAATVAAQPPPAFAELLNRVKDLAA